MCHQMAWVTFCTGKQHVFLHRMAWYYVIGKNCIEKGKQKSSRKCSAWKDFRFKPISFQRDLIRKCSAWKDFKTILCLKNLVKKFLVGFFLVLNTFWVPKNFLGQNIFMSEMNFGPQKMLAPKIFCISKNFNPKKT